MEHLDWSHALHAHCSYCAIFAEEMDFCNAQLFNVSKNFDDLISSDGRSSRADIPQGYAFTTNDAEILCSVGINQIR